MALTSVPALTGPMIAVICLFVLTYALLLVFSEYRSYIAAGSAAVFITLGYAGLYRYGFYEALSSIEWNVIMMIFGTMGVVGLFIESKMPALLAEKIIKKAGSVRAAVIGLTVFSGVISAFVDNVATVLMVAPIALVVCRKLRINPVPVVISISVASNLEGSATLVGDTTSILLGQYAGMNFLDFFFYQGRISSFFYNQIGLLASTGVLFFIFRKQKEHIDVEETTVVKEYFPTFLMLSVVVLLVAASFLPPRYSFSLINGTICLSLFMIGAIWRLVKARSFRPVRQMAMSVDYLTLLMLISVFIIVEALVKAGVIDWIGAALTWLSGGNIFLAYTIIVWMSVLVSAFIDNIPYTVMMLPVVSSIAINLGANPVLFYFGLLAGATLGGNLTPVGASANITGIGILRKSGSKVSTWDFMRIGIPYTLAAVISAYALIWLIWGL